MTRWVWAGFESAARTPGEPEANSQLSSVSIPKMAGNKSYTIVEYFGGDDGYRCGYCKNEKGNFSHGKCLIE